MSHDTPQLRHVQYQARFKGRVYLRHDESVSFLKGVCLAMLESCFTEYLMGRAVKNIMMEDDEAFVRLVSGPNYEYEYDAHAKCEK